MKNKKIAVLMGGWNSEREVSLKSGEAAYQALVALGYDAEKIDFSRNIVSDLQKIKPDIVFNALHGQYCEDGRIQGLLDILQIPYTHSGVLSSALAMDKVLATIVCEGVGVKSPRYDFLQKNYDEKNLNVIKEIGKPFVIKPINEGSSVGVEVFLESMQFYLEKYEWKYGDKILIEEYIAGKEIQVAVMNGKALGAIEVRPKKLFYDYECKYTAGMTDYIMPAEISPEKYQEILSIAEKCHNALKCSGVSRIDFILSKKDNEFYFLEANTQPGFTPTSLVPKIAKYVGISFEEIVEYLVLSAKYD
jgi:D-alanine-D-alanine ligase